MDEIINEIKNKKILILGFAREGKSTYEIIRKYLPNKELDVIDSGIDIQSKENQVILQDKHLNIIKVKDFLPYLDNYECIFKSPGISFKGIDTKSFKDKITSQLEMFLKYTKAITIGITGTKGKSTTSTLMYEIIKEQNSNVHFLGNIGKPIFTEIENIKDKDIVILEISSHQAEFIKYSPHIGVILNIFEEHLDHYNSFNDYINAKINVLRFQKKDDFALYNLDNKNLIDNLKNVKLKSKMIPISIEKKSQYLYFDFNKKRNIIGEHNAFNIMVVLEIANILKLDLKKACNIIYSFKGLPHRLENIGIYNGVTYYNDSISTIPEATIQCIKSLKDVNTVLIGGLDRGINYSNLIKFLADSDVKNILCMYSSGKKVYDELIKLSINKNIQYFDSLDDAVKIAKQITKKGTICALSPAAASYDHFKNFEERGKKFKELVNKL